MTFADIILLLLFGVVCYVFGKISMAHTIVKKILEETDDESQPKDNSTLLNGELFVEKVNGCYYAYVDQAFVGQATTFNDLFTAIKQREGIGAFTVKTDLDTLNAEERDSMIKALTDVFGVK